MRSKTGNRPSFRSSNAVSNTGNQKNVFKNIINADLRQASSINTSSFKYDPDGVGLRSTQEIPVDYTRFENHTFFNSARGKVDTAFDLVINQYPYDKTRADIELYLDQLTGYEKYVYDNFPKNTGYLNFSGSAAPGSSNGTYIEVRDGKSLNFPILNNVDYGSAILDPGISPFAIEMHVMVPSQVNSNQIIAQRISTTAGMTLALSSSTSTTECKVLFLVSSASDAYVIASGSINKGQWVHLCAQLTPFNGGKRAAIYVDNNTIYESSDDQDFGSISFSGASMFIGSGSLHNILDYNFMPSYTFSGSIDEIRYFKEYRSSTTLRSYSQREIYAESGSLTAYFKLNEPSGSYAGNNVALDSSGNKLHSYINNYTTDLRNTSSLSNPIIYENTAYSPVLFANYAGVKSLNSFLLDDAAAYDDENPNFILKLIPMHYLALGAAASGFQKIDQNLGLAYSAASVPGTGNLQKPQLILSFLLTYAKFFDELKIFLDYFSHINYVELDDPESAIDKFLPFVAQYYGLELPNFFSNTTPDQFFYGQSLQNDYALAQQSLKDVRHQIWRRILGNFKELTLSKGTRSSIRSAILSTGIIPDNFFNIREYGGPPLQDLAGLRQQTQETSAMLDMSGSLSPTSYTKVGSFFTQIPHFYTPYLSGSRVEPGIPGVVGTFVNVAGTNISNQPNDGLMTSGSFSIESFVKFRSSTSHANTQSLLRLQTTGSSEPSNTGSCLLNVVYAHDASTESGYLTLKVRSSKQSLAPALNLVLTGVNMFNGEKWHVACGRDRGDLINSVSSSYFLRCGYQEDKVTYTYFTTSSYFCEVTGSDYSQDMFQNVNSSYNASGSYLIIGSQSLGSTSTYFLNNSSDNALSYFDGLVSQVRFWSKSLNSQETLEHLRNYRSLGVEDPKINFNFDTESSGTFERLRVDVSIDQATTASNASGSIRLFDFSQNNLHMSGSGFQQSVRLIKPEYFAINRISPNIDLLQSDDKVRVRSLLDPLATVSYTSPAPVYELGPDTSINDDNRLSIEYSAIKALNEDIIGLFGDTSAIDSALGHTSYMFDNIYPDLEKISKVYFDRLVDPVDLRRYLDLFKWFDSSLTMLLNQLIPRKVNFLGVNYVIESHILERHRHRYLFDKQYLGAERAKTDLDIYLTAVEAVIKRY
jgi:hypothetical protein